MQMRLIITFFLGICLTLGQFPVLLAAEILGSCAEKSQSQSQSQSQYQHQFPVSKDDPLEISTSLPVRVLRQNAELFLAPTGAGQSGRLDFDTILEPNRLPPKASSSTRIQVKRSTEQRPIGWIERRDLLCQQRPLKQGRLERRAFIRTQPASQSAEAQVQAYGDPARRACPQRGCSPLTRFQHAFVFAEDRNTGSFLLARHYLLGDPFPLVGWVKGKETIEWNSRFALRPKDDRETVYLYPTEQDAIDRTNGYPTVGNNDGRWYRYPLHVPILQKFQEQGVPLFRVSAPTPGVLVSDARIGESASEFGAIEALNRLNRLKNMDILFLLDGSNSMSPFIEQAKQAAKEIAERLVRNLEHRGNRYRFGFRVYRDTYADNLPRLDCENGVCEGRAMPSQCEVSSQEGELREFLQAMEPIRATTNDRKNGDKDFEEKLFAGVRQALTDLKGCEGHLKVLIILGDHGDRADRIPQALREEIHRWRVPPWAYILQMVKNPSLSGRGDYEHAYQAFSDQGRELIKLMVPEQYEGHRIDRDALFISASQNDAKKRIVDHIDRYTSSRDIEALKSALQGGQALKSFLDARMQQGDMPILFWERVGRNLCPDKNRSCLTAVNHQVTDGYIRDNAGWEKEVWLREEALSGDKGLTKLLGAIVSRTASNPAKLRESLKRALAKSIEEFTGGEPPFTSSGEELDEFIRRATDLPLRDDPMFFQYSGRNLDTIDRCEIRHLLGYLSIRKEILASIENHPSDRPDYRIVNRRPACPLGPKGQNIPTLEFHPRTRQPLCKDNKHCSYYRTTGVGKGYWLPEDLLP